MAQIEDLTENAELGSSIGLRCMSVSIAQSSFCISPTRHTPI